MPLCLSGNNMYFRRRMKFLILRFSSIGDIVLTTPVIRCLKKKYPDAEIHYATKMAFASILQSNPYLTKIHILGDSVMSLVKELKAERFDHVIDLHHNQRTLLIKFLLGVKSYSFNKLNLEKWLMVNFKIDRLPEMHIVDRYLETCHELGVENDGEGLDYFIQGQDEVNRDILPVDFREGFVGWAIGAKQNTKKFPIEKIIRAIAQMGKPVVLMGGKEDTEAAEYICKALAGKAIFNACGQFKLNQSASLVKQASLMITNDTGLMHIAAAMKKPVISIWGNTVPAFGMYPYYGNKKVQLSHGKGDANWNWQKFEVADLKCRPCSKLGYSKCPLGHFNCMNKINEAGISEMINGI